MNGTAMIRGPSTDEPETSLSLAEDYVREFLVVASEGGLDAGDEVEVCDLNRCDCVPINVPFQSGGYSGNWHLSGVRERGYRKTFATYRWEPKR